MIVTRLYRALSFIFIIFLFNEFNSISFRPLSLNVFRRNVKSSSKFITFLKYLSYFSLGLTIVILLTGIVLVIFGFNFSISRKPQKELKEEAILTPTGPNRFSQKEDPKPTTTVGPVAPSQQEETANPRSSEGEDSKPTETETVDPKGSQGEETANLRPTETETTGPIGRLLARMQLEQEETANQRPSEGVDPKSSTIVGSVATSQEETANQRPSEGVDPKGSQRAAAKTVDPERTETANPEPSQGVDTI